MTDETNTTNKVGIFILMFIVAMISIPLFSTVSDSIHEETTIFNVVNESTTFVAKANYTTVSQNDLTGITYFGNNSHNLIAYLGTELNYSSDGRINISGTNILTGKYYNISYNFEPDNYVDFSTSRALLAMIELFFVLGILAGIIYYLSQFGLFSMFQK